MPHVDPQIATFIVLAVALYLFVSEKLPVDVTALLIPVALGILNVLTPAEALKGFGNPAVVTVAAIFVISRALVESGSLAALGGTLQRVVKGGNRRVLFAVVTFVIVPSMLINNTFVVVVFMPVVLALAADLNLPPSRLLLPLSYASIFGGCCTSVGTSTTVLVSAAVADRAMAPLGFFEPLAFGGVIVAAGTAYVVFLAPRLLPARRTLASTSPELRAEYVTEVMLVPGSPLAGRTLRDAVLEPHPELKVIEIIRGEEILWPGDGSLSLEEGDTLFVRGQAKALMKIGTQGGAQLLPELRGQGVRQRDVTLAELVLTRNSPLLGRTVREAMLRAVHGAGVMAVQRQGAHLRAGVADLVLRTGDTLLVQVEAARLPELRGTDDFLLLEGLHEELVLQRKAPLVLAATAAVIVLAALEVMDISFLALGAATLLVVTRCLTPRKAYRALDMSTLVLMGGTIALGVAIEKSGAAGLLAAEIRSLARGPLGGDRAAYAALAAVWLGTNVLTCLISNVAAAAVVLPVALNTAKEMGADERPFILAVVFAASLALATPMGYQTNLLVWNPGGYKFTDYARFGLPLQVLLFVLAVFLLPVFFPF